MWACFWRECIYLLKTNGIWRWLHSPLCVVVLFASMFYQGKPDHLPIALIDQDHSQLSRIIEQDLRHNPTLDLKYVLTNTSEAEELVNKTQIWGYVHVPEGAEQRLVNAQDAQISVAFNQSFLVLATLFQVPCSSAHSMPWASLVVNTIFQHYCLPLTYPHRMSKSQRFTTLA